MTLILLYKCKMGCKIEGLKEACLTGEEDLLITAVKNGVGNYQLADKVIKGRNQESFVIWWSVCMYIRGPESSVF